MTAIRYPGLRLPPLAPTSPAQAAVLKKAALVHDLDRWFNNELDGPFVVLCRLANRARHDILEAVLTDTPKIRVNYFDSTGELGNLLRKHDVPAELRELLAHGHEDKEVRHILERREHLPWPDDRPDVPSRHEVFRLLCHRFPADPKDRDRAIRENRAKSQIMDAFLAEHRTVTVEFDGPPFDLQRFGLGVRRRGDAPPSPVAEPDG